VIRPAGIVAIAAAWAVAVLAAGEAPPAQLPGKLGLEDSEAVQEPRDLACPIAKPGASCGGSRWTASARRCR
jgi:hypothetical protein